MARGRGLLQAWDARPPRLACRLTPRARASVGVRRLRRRESTRQGEPGALHKAHAERAGARSSRGEFFWSRCASSTHTSPLPPRFRGLRKIDADRQRWAKSSEIESLEQRRARLVRNARQRTMYGPTHRRRRAQFARRIERGEFPMCQRCALGIGPDDLWDLGHDDIDPRIERPEHRACNRAAANQLKWSREW